MEESQRSEKYKNKNIYDAYTSYLEYDNIEKLLKYSEEDITSSYGDIISIMEDMDNLERKWNTISINIHSSKGIFNSIYEYTNLISKKKIEKEEIHKAYESLRKEIDEDLKSVINKKSPSLISVNNLRIKIITFPFQEKMFIK